jgi:hypothetical protein
MQIDQDRLKNENTNLVAAFREKSRKHQQTQELYDRLKRKEMTAATQSAAYQSVDEVLGSVAGRHGQDHPSGMSQYPNMGRAQGQSQQYQYQGDLNGPAQDYGHRRNNSNGSNGNGKDGVMLPPPRRPAGFGAPGLGSCQSSYSVFLHLRWSNPNTRSSPRIDHVFPAPLPPWPPKPASRSPRSLRLPQQQQHDVQ